MVLFFSDNDDGAWGLPNVVRAAERLHYASLMLYCFLHWVFKRRLIYRFIIILSLHVSFVKENTKTNHKS